MIFDTAGLPIYSAAIGLGSDEVKTAQIDVDCRSGYRLKGTEVDGVTVEAKHEDGISWTDLETSTIDLTPWAGSRERFLIRFNAATVAEFDRPVFTLAVELGV